MCFSQSDDTSCINVFQHCKFLRIFGSLMVVMVLGIIGLTTYAVIGVCYVDEANEGNVGIAATVITLYSFLLVMVLWSYFATLFTDPGRVPAGWQPTLEPRAGNDAGPPVAARWCKRCLVWKPDRCHHCSVCGRCVLKMDHHCVWVVNCVGGRNYKMFLLFLAYTFSACVFAVVALLPRFIAMFSMSEDDDEDGDDLTELEQTIIFIVTVMNIGFAFSVAGFLAMHITLVLSNTSTIEMYEKKRSTPWRYDLGARKNFEQVFGQTPMHWFIPVVFKEDERHVNVACGLADAHAQEGLLDLADGPPAAAAPVAGGADLLPPPV